MKLTVVVEDAPDGWGFVVTLYGLDGRRTYCRRCVTQQELDAVRDRAVEAATKMRGGRR